MECRMSIANPDEVPVTLTITMKLGEWRTLDLCLEESPRAGAEPAWGLRHRIHHVLRHVQHAFAAPHAVTPIGIEAAS